MLVHAYACEPETMHTAHTLLLPAGPLSRNDTVPERGSRA